MDSNGCNITDGFHIPDFGKQFIFGKYMVRILCQKCQQIKLFRSKLFFFFVDPYTTGCFINTDATDLNDIIFCAVLPIRRSYRARCAFTRATSSLGENGFVI